MFVCRICGFTHCNMQFDGLYSCGGCNVVFSTPSGFTLPDVKFKRLHPDAVIPVRAKEGDVGYDVCSIENVILEPMEVVMVKTGISVELPPHTEMQVRPRSGLAKNHGIMVVNSPGTVDTGYRGPCNVLLINTTTEDYIVRKGDKIAQFLVTPKLPYKFVEVDELSDTDRGVGGFGHTGK
jgi:dUTP pyrophosphatase